jgi:putative inorganic carbon (HCO3(-)) transporter
MISAMNALAAISGPAPRAGVVIAGALVAIALVHPGPRVRAGAMLGGLVLAPVLLLAEIWSSPQLGFVHRHPLEAAVAGLAALAAVAVVALAIFRRPWLLGPLVVFTLPFRIPISAGGTTSNLLVPLYLVVGSGVLAHAARVLGRGSCAGQREDGRAQREDGRAQREEGRAQPHASPGWIERLLALYVGLYALQALYSPDFTKALQNMVFFYVPFALMLCLLRRLRWSRTLLGRCLGVAVGLAVVFAMVGFVEYATRTLLLNPKLIAVNNVHVYFAINSVFFDPNIFGRYLALVMVTVATVLLYTRRRSLQLGSAVVLAVLWAALVLTLSRSSLGALLVGLGVLGALRWKARPFLLAGVAVVVAGIAAVAISPTAFGLNQGLNGASAGRAGLVGGGVRLFARRPGWGYGSGAFETEYLCRIRHICGQAPSSAHTLSASHTIPITIAAEQGLVGEIPYLALVLLAAVVLLRGARRDPPRAAIAAAFLALVFHTLLYAEFLEDPITWTLLGAGLPLADAARFRLGAITATSGELTVVA